MKHIVISLGIFSLCSTGYAAVDLTCEAILEPSADYVLADSVIVPKLKITNLGDQGASNFWVKLIVVEVYYTDTIHRDTIYAESIKIGYIGANPATIEVEMLEWTPEGMCDDAEPNGDGPFWKYELLGIPEAAFDTNHSNDSCFEEVTSLFEHDVGVIALHHAPEDPYPDCYKPGTEVVITATVENFGFSEERKVPVRLEILDKTAEPDTIVYRNIQLVEFLNWRGDTISGLYAATIDFPRWIVPSRNWFTRSCKTELVGDNCRDDDFCVWNINGPPCDAIEEIPPIETVKLEEPRLSEGVFIINYSLPISSWLRLDVYDASGRFVRNLYNDPCSAGKHTLTWDGKDSGGKRVSSGAYFVRMETGGESITSKFISIR